MQFCDRSQGTRCPSHLWVVRPCNVHHLGQRMSQRKQKRGFRVPNPLSLDFKARSSSYGDAGRESHKTSKAPCTPPSTKTKLVPPELEGP